MQCLRRAPHIVRSLLWADDILTDVPIEGGIENFCQEMDNRKDLIYLEFMKGGCLFDLLGKAVAAGVLFPNGFLWKVFFCRKCEYLTASANLLTRGSCSSHQLYGLVLPWSIPLDYKYMRTDSGLGAPRRATMERKESPTKNIRKKVMDWCISTWTRRMASTPMS